MYDRINKLSNFYVLTENNGLYASGELADEAIHGRTVNAGTLQPYCSTAAALRQHGSHRHEHDPFPTPRAI
jgi:hypothetical protein